MSLENLVTISQKNAASSYASSIHDNYNTKASITNQNSLLDAANKLLTEISYIKRRRNCTDILQLRKHLLNEIHKFQIKAETLRYDTDNILISRFAISATIDETISKTIWGQEKNWAEHAMLQTAILELALCLLSRFYPVHFCLFYSYSKVVNITF